MKVEKFDGSQDRLVLQGMIVHSEVLSRIASKWDGEMFQSRSMNMIASWCVKHFQRHGVPPTKDIISLFWKWADNKGDKDTIDQIERILTDINIEIDPTDINSGYVIDLAGERFNDIRTQRTCEQALEDISAGRSLDARAKMEAYSRVELGVNAGIDVLNDEERILAVFNRERAEPLIEYSGDLKRFLGDSLARDNFVVFSGPAKVGKTWYLVDMAYRAMCQRKRVAFFEVGDLSEDQILERFLCRISHRPTQSDEGWPLTVKYPESIVREGEGSYVEFKDKNFDHALEGKESVEAARKLKEKTIKSKKPYLRLSTHANFSISILGVKSILEGWANEGWNADVVILDYVDLLSPVDSKIEKRDQVNDTWKHMRALSQTFHCLVVTASQTDAASFDTKKVLSRTNFSEDNRKWAHVTSALGINVRPEEKEMGVSRLNYIVRREGAYSPNKCIYLAGCLAIGNPVVLSTF